MLTIDQLKNIIYVDKVYNGLQHLNNRTFPEGKTVDLRTSELRIFSQNGEDGVLHALIESLNIQDTFFVEFGIGDGWSCNTRFLAEIFDWSGVYFEMNTSDYTKAKEKYSSSNKVNIFNEAISRKTVNEQFKNASVPDHFGVLSLDIDGQDYWVLDALSEQFKPAIMVLEYNSSRHSTDIQVEEKDLDQSHVLSSAWGASLGAMCEIANNKGYELVHTEIAGVNAFFVRKDLIENSGIKFKGVLGDRSPNYGLKGKNHNDEVLYGTSKEKNERPTVNIK